MTAFTLLNGVAFWGYALFLIFIGGLLGLLVPRWAPFRFVRKYTTRVG